MNAQNDLAFIKIIGILIAVVAIGYVVYIVYTTLKGFTEWGGNVLSSVGSTVKNTIIGAQDFVVKKVESAKEILTGDGTAANPPLLSETSAMQAADEGGYIMYQ
jgi:hypothetical protein